MAALGAIGDPAGLAAVLGRPRGQAGRPATGGGGPGRLRGSRRRAALRRCLDDRDWQVRQVAEDLLEVE